MRNITLYVLVAVFSLISSNQSYSFDVTPGQSGAWYDPSHDGEGYFLQILNDSQALAFWFTYDKSGKQFWMLGIGDIEGSKITFPELLSAHGGKFGPEFDPEAKSNQSLPEANTQKFQLFLK